MVIFISDRVRPQNKEQYQGQRGPVSKDKGWNNQENVTVLHAQVPKNRAPKCLTKANRTAELDNTCAEVEIPTTLS